MRGKRLTITAAESLVVPGLPNMSMAVLAHLEHCCHQQCQHRHLYPHQIHTGITRNKPRPGPVEPEQIAALQSHIYAGTAEKWEKNCPFLLLSHEGLHRFTRTSMCQWSEMNFFQVPSQLVRCVLCCLSFTEVQLYAITFLSLWAQTQTGVEYKSAASSESWCW